MPTLEWPTEEQRTSEFRTAKHYLRCGDGSPAPAGTILDNPSTPKKLTDPETKLSVELTYQFIIDANGNIYAQDKAPFAKGRYGQATILETEDRKLWVIKKPIITQDMPINAQLHQETFAANEASIACDLGIASTFQTPPFFQHIIIYEYLGETLAAFIKREKSSLSDQALLALALQTTLAMLELHEGKKSKNKQGYAHLDGKPSNLTIDDQGKVHFIDFGLTEPLAGKMTQFKGAMGYLPPFPDRDTLLAQDKAAIDCFALLRLLFFPPMPIDTLGGKHILDGKEGICILTEEIIHRPALEPIFRNLEHSTYTLQYSVVQLYVALILTIHNLDDQFKTMSADQCADFARRYRAAESHTTVDTSFIKRLLSRVMKSSHSQVIDYAVYHGLFAQPKSSTADLAPRSALAPQ